MINKKKEVGGINSFWQLTEDQHLEREYRIRDGFGEK